MHDNMHGLKTPEKTISLINFQTKTKQSSHLISVASLAGPISERVVKPVALQRWKQDYTRSRS